MDTPKSIEQYVNCIGRLKNEGYTMEPFLERIAIALDIPPGENEGFESLFSRVSLGIKDWKGEPERNVTIYHICPKPKKGDTSNNITATSGLFPVKSIGS